MTEKLLTGTLSLNTIKNDGGEKPKQNSARNYAKKKKRAIFHYFYAIEHVFFLCINFRWVRHGC